MPQLITPPQPSETVSQSVAVQAFGMHPQRLAMRPPPHVAGIVHVPQSSMPPHLSDTAPQLAPSRVQVTGLHPQ
jgi:hypothetical protein